MIDIFNIQVTDQEEDDQFDIEINSNQSTQDSPQNILQNLSGGLSLSNQYFKETNIKNQKNYQEEMNKIEEEIQKEILQNDFTNYTKKERYKAIRKIKNKYSSRKSRLKKLLKQDNLEQMNQDLKKQVAGLKIQIQNLDKENQYLLESIYNLNQIIERHPIEQIKNESQKYRVEKQGNQFILNKNFILIVAICLIMTTNFKQEFDSTYNIKIAGFDHRYFSKINSIFNMDKVIIKRPLFLKQFKWNNKKNLLKKIQFIRKSKNHNKIYLQFNYQKFNQQMDYIQKFWTRKKSNDSLKNHQQNIQIEDEQQLLDIKESILLKDEFNNKENVNNQQNQNKKEYSEEDIIQLLNEVMSTYMEIRDSQIKIIEKMYRDAQQVLNTLLLNASQKNNNQSKEKLIENNKENLDKNKQVQINNQKLYKILTSMIQQKDLKLLHDNLQILQNFVNNSQNCQQLIQKHQLKTISRSGSFLKKKKKKQNKSISVKNFNLTKSPQIKFQRQMSVQRNCFKSKRDLLKSPYKEQDLLSRKSSMISQISTKQEFLNLTQRKIQKQKKIISKLDIEKIEKNLRIKRKYLLLDKNRIDDHFLNYILSKYNTFFQFPKINLSNNNITNDGLAILFHHIIEKQNEKNFKIKSIILKNNKLNRKINMLLNRMTQYYKGETIQIRVDRNLILWNTSQSRISQKSDIQNGDSKKVYFSDQLKINKLKLENQKKVQRLKKKIIKTTMSCQPMNELSEQAKNQLACNLAVLILHDEKSDITSESISRLVKESGNTVPDYWPMLLAKALEGQDVSSYLQVSGGGGSGSGPAQQDGGNQEAAQEDEKPETEEESEDMDMGGLFD